LKKSLYYDARSEKHQILLKLPERNESLSRPALMSASGTRWPLLGGLQWSIRTWYSAVETISIDRMER